MAITAEIGTITPRQASSALAQQFGNRKLKEDLVARITRDIKSGFWELNGQPIIFDDEGYLMDGQHRLSACVRSGVSIKTLIVRGIPRKAFSTLDCGGPRSKGDVLFIKGKDRPVILAAALRYPWLHEADLLADASALARLRPTNRDIEQLEATYPTMPQFIASTYTAPNGILRRAIFPGLYYICSAHNKSMSESFWRPLCLGAQNLPAGSPMRTLRERLMREKEIKRKRGSMSDRLVIALVTKAWNAHVNGKRIGILAVGHLEKIPHLVLPKRTIKKVLP